MAPGNLGPAPGSIAGNLQRVQDRIATAATLAGRSPDEVTLVAVTKTRPWAVVAEALAAGQRDFGENRPEEAFAKFSGAPSDAPRTPVAASQAMAPRLHLIGPIQSRKAALALACQPALIHSLDRLKIARKLSELAQSENRVLDVLCEVNLAGEATKSGFSLADLHAALPELLALPGLCVHGLMAIPPLELDAEAARPYFAALRRLRDDLALAFPQTDWSQLSMGMSHDFAIAIAEGATLVRVGSAIFGPRG